MTTTIIVMLIWVGHHDGGPATIQGFRSLAACERAIPVVMAPAWQRFSFTKTEAKGATCVEMRTE